MKLISLSITAFGKLHNVNLDFNDGLNVFYEKNGWGKSTLSSFVKVMFYGFDNENSRDEYTKERKRYMPWGGGAYGGSLIFETNGIRYKVTRIFHEKAALDEFDLRYYDTNLPSQDYSPNLGEELFNINSDSFMKTVFVRQSETYSTGTTGDINSKLGNITDGIDLNKYQLAQDILKDNINALLPNRKTGEINRLKSRASELKAEIAKSSKIEAGMDEVENRINETNRAISDIKTELGEIDKERERIASYEKVKALKQQYLEFDEKIKNKEADRVKFAGIFDNRVPSERVQKEWQSKKEAMIHAEMMMENNRFSTEEEMRFDSLLKMFSMKDIDDISLNDAIEKAQLLEDIAKEASKNSLSDSETILLNSYEQNFAYLVSPVDSVNEEIKKIDRVKKLQLSKEDARRRAADLESETETDATKANVIVIIFGILALLSAVGVFAYSFIRSKYIFLLLGGALAALGIILTVAFVVKKQKLGYKSEAALKTIDSINKEIALTESEISILINEIRTFIINCGIESSNNDYDDALRTLLINASEYEKLKQKSQYHNEILELNNYEELKKELSNYISSLGFEGEDKYLKTLWEIKNKYDIYLRLLSKKKNYDIAKDNYEKEEHLLRQSLWDYNIEPGTDILNKLDEINSVLANLYDLDKEISGMKQLKESFCINNPDIDFETPVCEFSGSVESINERENTLTAKFEELTNRLNTDCRSLDTFREQYEERQDLIEELEELETTILQKTQVFNNLVKTQEFLTKAKENLTAKYMEPLMNGFRKYYELLTGDKPDNYYIDANSDITVEEEGKLRNTVMLSSGYRDLIGLCMRLAMADAMYPDEKPMLIMDDPFVNLDDDKLSLSSEFLKNISDYYQIMYLTCSKNRI